MSVGAFHLIIEASMKKQIATATVTGALLALACLCWEQQTIAAQGGSAAARRAPIIAPAIFDRHLKYRDI
jgi:hypothetical protein